MNNMLKGEDIICFAGEDWWYHNPHSNLHIMKSFAKENRVLFVNSIGIRMPSFKKDKFAWKRISGKLKSLLRYLRKAEKNIYVLTPAAIPLLGRFERPILKINKHLLVWQLLLVMRILNFKRPVLWATLPTVKDVVLILKECKAKCLVYYCTDNVSYLEGADQKKIFDLDVELQRNADVAFFVNHELLEERKKYNSNTHYLSHGVDFGHFEKTVSGSLPVPEDIRDIRRPIAGHVGAIRDLDFNLIRSLAVKNKDISFVFIGDPYSDISLVKDLPNVHFLGKKPYEELPAYMQCFDVSCLFYKTGGPWIDYSNPKKLLEYLATGIPVVSVWLPELEYSKEYVYIAKTHEAYHENLKNALKENSKEKRQQRIDIARRRTWDHVAAEAGQRIVEINKYQKALDRFLSWLRRNGYESFDPYDFWATWFGLFTRRIYYRNRFLGTPPAVLVALLEFLPPAFRSLFIPKKRYAIADAQLVLGHLNLFAVTHDGVHLEGARHLAEDLLRSSIPGYSGHSWGYPFDWQNNRGLWKKNTPFTFVTAYVFEAFLALYDTTKEKKYLDAAYSIAQFIFNDIKDSPVSDDASAASYSPFDSSQVVNASAYRALVLFEAARRFGEGRFREKAVKNLNFVLRSQKPDGSWFYAEASSADAFIDHFHTVFVLKNLYKLNVILQSKEVAQAIEKGYAFYRKNLFDGQNNPIPFTLAPRRQWVRWELYDLSEAILLGILIRRAIPAGYALAKELADKAVDRTQLPDGRFVSRVYRGGLPNTTPYMRWGQVQMFYALTSFLKEKDV